MPVPRPRGREERVKYVIVRRTGLEEEVDLEDVDGFFEPSPTVNQLLSGSKARRQATPSDVDYDSDDDDDDDDYDDDRYPSGRPPPPPPYFTSSPPFRRPTSLPDNDPSRTARVTSTSSPTSPPSKGGGGISQTTEHLLIAAGSVGATIIIVMILLAIHTMRRRGLTLSEAFQLGRYRLTRRGPPPPPPKKAGGWESKRAYNGNYGSMHNTITEPQRAMSINRSGSTSSQRPLMALQRSESFRNGAESENTQQTFLLDAPPRRNKSNKSHRRNGSSETTSSAALPLQQTRRSASTHNTRSMVESELKYPDPPMEQPLSPLPPPPTFKQFLFNRPSISGQPKAGGPMISRFSWTNSQAPQTPHDPHRDTNTHTIGRDSFMTQRSSVPRFRTVDSWVNQQANRIEEQKLKEQFRLTGTSTVYSGDDGPETIPEVPTLPPNVGQLRETSPPTISVIEAPKAPKASPPPFGGGLPGKNIKHERQDTHTTVETAPIFRQHPGTEVRFSTHSVVPSEILDMGREPNVLS